MVAFVLHGLAEEGWPAAPRPFDALDATGVLAFVLEELRIRTWSLGEPPGDPMHPGRAATVLIGGSPAGVVGELHPRAAAALDLDGRVALAELEVDALRAAASAATFRIEDVPRFPPVRRDLAFVVAEDAPAGAVRTALEDAAGELLGTCLLFDVHRGDPLPAGTKSLAFAVEFRAPDRTLTSEEADRAVSDVVRALGARFGATLRAG
jgi:phenylalanyl-tRNA synthetase beta chain